MGFPGRPWASLASVRAVMALGLVALLLVGAGRLLGPQAAPSAEFPDPWPSGLEPNLSCVIQQVALPLQAEHSHLHPPVPHLLAFRAPLAYPAPRGQAVLDCPAFASGGHPYTRRRTFPRFSGRRRMVQRYPDIFFICAGRDALGRRSCVTRFIRDPPARTADALRVTGE
jgi:hypothetical protein